MAKVTGVPGLGHAKFNNAWLALGINLGDSHPTVPNAHLEEVAPSAIDRGDVIQLVLLYREHFTDSEQNGGGQIEVGSSMSQVTTNKDATGKLMKVTYKGKDQHGSLSVPRSQTTVHITRTENGSPGGKARTYVGTTNSTPWAIDPGAAIRTWLCTGIVGRSRDGGKTYEVSYSFQYKEETWDDTVVYIDEQTGRIPADVSDSNGNILIPTAVKTFIVTKTNDFNSLSLA